MSLLDIYGFECFQTNSFEQLCINYANERLQQQFAAHLFKLEQAMYEEEGVDWTYVEFEDNQACVDLIEAKPPAGLGILTLLDEECLFPKGTDATFSRRFARRIVRTSALRSTPTSPDEAFTVHHYAGPVTYTRRAIFLDKNRDTLNPDLVTLVRSSESSRTFGLPVAAHGRDEGQVAPVPAPTRRWRRPSVPASASSSRRSWIAWMHPQLHFVRCIKPNASQQPMPL